MLFRTAAIALFVSSVVAGPPILERRDEVSVDITKYAKTCKTFTWTWRKACHILCTDLFLAGTVSDFQECKARFDLNPPCDDNTKKAKVSAGKPGCLEHIDAKFPIPDSFASCIEGKLTEFEGNVAADRTSAYHVAMSSVFDCTRFYVYPKLIPYPPPLPPPKPAAKGDAVKLKAVAGTLEEARTAIFGKGAKGIEELENRLKNIGLEERKKAVSTLKDKIEGRKMLNQIESELELANSMFNSKTKEEKIAMLKQQLDALKAKFTELAKLADDAKAQYES